MKIKPTLLKVETMPSELKYKGWPLPSFQDPGLSVLALARRLYWNGSQLLMYYGGSDPKPLCKY